MLLLSLMTSRVLVTCQSSYLKVQWPSSLHPMLGLLSWRLSSRSTIKLTCGSGPLLHMACPSSHRCGYGCCSVRATTSHCKRKTYECCSSQSWFWKDLLADLSELIEVYLIYAHPNFHTYSYFIQFNIHLFLKSIQKLKLQNVATSNREHIQFQI